MYDFCLTPIYAALLAIGGLIGFFAKGSTASLGGGVGSATFLSGLAYYSYLQYEQGRLCRPATLLSLAVSAALTYVMWQRYQRTHKVFPALVVALLSAFMSAFYVWNVLFFSPNLDKKRKA